MEEYKHSSTERGRKQNKIFKFKFIPQSFRSVQG